MEQIHAILPSYKSFKQSVLIHVSVQEVFYAYPILVMATLLDEKLKHLHVNSE